MQIGHSNHFQIGCQISSPQIGDCNSFEPKCITVGWNCLSIRYLIPPLPGIVGSSISIPSGCIIGAGMELAVSQPVEDDTVFSASQRLGQKLPGSKQVGIV